MSRFCEITTDPNAILPPIQGYETKPLVSIEQALQPIKTIIPQIDHMLHNVRSACHNNIEPLSKDEALAIMLYTLEWSTPELSFYSIINATLRNKNRRALIPYFSFLRLFIHALLKLPQTAPRILYRAVPTDMSAIYSEKTCIWWSFSSCTTRLDVLDGFLKGAEHRTIFNIKCKSAIDISRHSYLTDEAEFLLLPGRQFSVNSVYRAATDLHIIELEEIDPPFLLFYAPLISNNDVNILLLGETGVGKSTLINAMINYFHYESFSEARGKDLKFVIPFEFPFCSEDFDEHIISFGESTDYEHVACDGRSATLCCRSYVFRLGDRILRLIDTPPIADTEGPERDRQNMANIIAHVAQLSHLNAICLLFKPDRWTFLQPEEYAFQEMLRLLDRKFAANIIFLFTFARQVFFCPGKTVPLIKDVLHSIKEDSGIQIPFSENNRFFVDNEGFRWLAALHKGLKLDEESLSSYKAAWSTSMEQLSRFLSCASNFEPRPVQDLVTLFSLFRKFEVIVDVINERHPILEQACTRLISLIKKNSTITSYDYAIEYYSAYFREIEGARERARLLEKRGDMLKKYEVTSQSVETWSTIVANDEMQDLGATLRKVYDLPVIGKQVMKRIQEIEAELSGSAKIPEVIIEMPAEGCGSSFFRKMKDKLNRHE